MLFSAIGVYGKADDLSAIIDGSGHKNQQSRINRKQSVEVGYCAVLPNNRGAVCWITGQTDYLTFAVDAERAAEIVAGQGAKVCDDAILPKKSVASDVTRQRTPTDNLPLIVDRLRKNPTATQAAEVNCGSVLPKQGMARSRRAITGCSCDLAPVIDRDSKPIGVARKGGQLLNLTLLPNHGLELQNLRWRASWVLASYSRPTRLLVLGY